MEAAWNPWRRIDMIGTALAAAVLAGGAMMAFAGVRFIMQLHELWSDMDATNVPKPTLLLVKIEENYGLDLLVLVLLGIGIFLLVAVKDRLRANLYAGLVGILLALCAGSFAFIAYLPVIKIISLMGNAS